MALCLLSFVAAAVQCLPFLLLPAEGETQPEEVSFGHSDPVTLVPPPSDSRMGNHYSHLTATLKEPATTPKFETESTFDPQLGFEKPRKERVMLATKEEMIATKIPPKDFGYCAHLLLQFRACRKREMPFLYNCYHDKHVYLECMKEDWEIRMKEYEREWRMLKRQERIDKRKTREQMETE